MRPSLPALPTGRLLEGMIEVIDERHSANLAPETVKGQRENALRGYSNGGVPPFGYRAVKVHDERGNEKTQWAPDSDTGPVVREVYEMYAGRGMGLFAIAQELNSRGVRTPRGRLWSETTLQVSSAAKPTLAAAYGIARTTARPAASTSRGSNGPSSKGRMDLSCQPSSSRQSRRS